MNEEFPESLYDEFITLQRLDPYFQGKKHRLDDEFYTEDYQKFLEENEREEAILSDDELESDEEMELVAFTQEEVMIRVVDYLDRYREIYKVPPVRIKNKDWEDLFTQIFDYYDSHNLLIYYDEDMIILNRLAIVRSLLYEKEALEIEDYRRSIEYLDSRVLYKNNKEELIEELEEKYSDNKVIPIEKYLKRAKSHI